MRASGEAYIYHPVAVARILAEMRMDAQSITAAILHDVIEDTAVGRDTISEEFGEDVALLVDGVSKLSHLQFDSKEEAQAASFRKMILAMASDLRVILVKLADRLHNMRTLMAVAPEKRRRKARETLDIYVPIAQRLGMSAIRRELEQLGFEALYPLRYRVLAAAVHRSKGQRKELVRKMEGAIVRSLEEYEIQARVHGREKNLWSIYRKMRDKQLSFAAVYDVFAVRIVAKNKDTCYRVLGAMHTLYKPVPGRFKDYIAIPKANGYQSLHTTLFGYHGIPIEVQIRTEAMDRVAETGIAAHWHYKSGDEYSTAAQRRAHEWLRSVMDLQQNTGNALEFMESLKVDLFPDEVYVFTPRGEIMELPRGATGLDFAYAVHSDIGNAAVSLKINRLLSPLSTPLQNGQTVEVMTAAASRPKSAWLNYVVTAKARHNIRQYLKNAKEQEAAKQGRLLLINALADKGYRQAELPETVHVVLNDLGYRDVDALYRDIGLGECLPAVVASKLLSDAEDQQDSDQDMPLLIEGAEGLVLSFANCCTPIPGDPIIGMMTVGKGMVVHRCECANVRRRNATGRVLAVDWAEQLEEDKDFQASIRLVTENQRGVLARIATQISLQSANISRVSIKEEDAVASTINMTIDVSGRKQLADILRKLRKVPEVIRLTRVLG
jgi:GTP pyrophosphokinase